jgi:hypothetical protein
MERLVFTFFVLLCSTAAFAGEPCCAIKSIDLKTGAVTAVDARQATPSTLTSHDFRCAWCKSDRTTS